MTLEQLLADLDARRGVHPGHRRPHLRRRSPPARLHRRDHPDRPRRQEPGPRRRPQTPPPHRGHAPRHGRARRRLHRRGLRNPTGPLPRPPRHPLVPRRPHQRRRPAASSAPTTTAASTTPSTRPDTCPAARSASTGGRRHTGKRDSRGGMGKPTSGQAKTRASAPPSTTHADHAHSIADAHYRPTRGARNAPSHCPARGSQDVHAGVSVRGEVDPG